MLNTSLVLKRTARYLRRGGFTLVELLVVIGIIAILAGVALGPITSGIKKAQQSGGVQSARTLALAEFQYSNDNNQSYPYGSDGGAFAQTLMKGGYVSDPGIFIISGATNETKYTGTTSSPLKANVSWDFGQASTTAGLNANAPDQAILVLSSGGSSPSFTSSGAVVSTVTSTAPFGTAGMALCYKSNSAKFIISPPASSGASPIEDASWPGYSMTTAPGNG